MGMFRSVYADRPCEHCGESRSVEIQFKTGVDCCERYTLGDLVAPDEGLRTGRTYEGITDRYCESCFRKWAIHQRAAMLESLAQLVETGRLQLRKKGSDAWISVEHLRDEKSPAPRAPWENDPDEHAVPSVTIIRPNFGFEVFWDGGEAKFPNNACKEYDRELDQRVGRALSDLGWTSGSDFMRPDLLVYLDDDSRIRVA
jgi:hypothetical protein